MKPLDQNRCIGISALAIFATAALLLPLLLRAQEKPGLTIERDCQSFAISRNDEIVCAVPHLKRIKKAIIERDDVWVATSSGREKLIIDGEKFMPATPPPEFSY